MLTFSDILIVLMNQPTNVLVLRDTYSSIGKCHEERNVMGNGIYHRVVANTQRPQTLLLEHQKKKKETQPGMICAVVVVVVAMYLSGRERDKRGNDEFINPNVP